MRKLAWVSICAATALIALVGSWRLAHPTPPEIPDYVASTPVGSLFYRGDGPCSPRIPGGVSHAKLLGSLGPAERMGPEDGFNETVWVAHYGTASGPPVYGAEGSAFLDIDGCYYRFYPEG